LQRLALGQFFAIGGLFGHESDVRSRFDLGLGLSQFRFALFTASDLHGDAQSVLQGRGVGLLGFGHKFGDLQIELPQLFFRVTMTDSRVFAGIGQDFGAVNGYGHFADIKHSTIGCQFEYLCKCSSEQCAVSATERAQRVMIGMRVRTKQAHRHVFIGRTFDLSTGKNSRRIAVNQQCQQHGRRILLAPGPSIVDRRRSRVHRVHRVDHKMNQVIRLHPVSQIRRQQQWRVPIYVYESCHILLNSNYYAKFEPKSDRLLASHPADFDFLREDPKRIIGASEEFFRAISPVTHLARICPKGAEVHGVKIEPGEFASLCFASANYDEEVFDAPEEVRLDRKPNPHVAFGFGPHLCLGAAHARLVIRTLIKCLCNKVQVIEVLASNEKREVETRYIRHLASDSLIVHFSKSQQSSAKSSR